MEIFPSLHSCTQAQERVNTGMHTPSTSVRQERTTLSIITFQVDNIDITGLKHMAAVNILRSTDKRVKLVVLRRPETVGILENRLTSWRKLVL